MSCTLYPGEKLEITEYAHFNFKDNPEMAELILLTPEELKEKEKDSVQQEEAIGSELDNTIAKWISQAQHTVNLRRAQEYLNLFPVQHTKNCWTEDGYGLTSQLRPLRRELKLCLRIEGDIPRIQTDVQHASVERSKARTSKKSKHVSEQNLKKER